MKTYTNIKYPDTIFDEYRSKLKSRHLTHILESEDKTRIMFVAYTFSRKSRKDIRFVFDTKTKKQLFSEVRSNSLGIKNYYSINNIFFVECSFEDCETAFVDRKIIMFGSGLYVLLKGIFIKHVSWVIKSYIKVLYLRNKLLKLIV